MLARFGDGDLEIIEQHVDHCRRRNLSPLTVKQRVSRLAQIADFYPNQSVLDITPTQLDAMLDTIKGNDGGPQKASSRRGFISILRTFYSWAHDYGHTDTNPMKRVVTPKVPEPLPRPIPEQDLEFALASAPTRLLRLWLMLGGSAGLRVGEIAGLLWDDIDLGGRTMRVVGKGDKTRVVPIAQEMIEPFHEHQRFRTQQPFVFTDSVFDRKYSPSNVTKILSRYLAEIGLPYTAHSLRHRFGTEACESSGDIRGVQDLMGHSSIEQTARYTLVRDHRRRSIVDGMRTAA